MRLFDETGWVRDSDGAKWECRWQRLEGSPIPKITRVLLRPPGSDIDTHYVNTGWRADTFQLALIDGEFEPAKLPRTTAAKAPSDQVAALTEDDPEDHTDTRDPPPLEPTK